MTGTFATVRVRAILTSTFAALASALLVLANPLEAQDESGERPDVPVEIQPMGLPDDACAVIAAVPSEGLDGTVEERRAHCEALQQRHFIRARELAESILRSAPTSFAAHFVLAYVYHYGEANAPRALYHLRRARELFAQRYGDPPSSEAAWRWHSQILGELVWVYADLEQYEHQLAAAAEFNERYSPQIIAENAWPLMKLRRWTEARRAAELGERSGDLMQREVALNALCAIEFEAGDESRSYSACRAALDLHGADPGSQSAVDFTNFAEASRSVFRLDEAEEYGLQATQAMLSWYGNPYVEISELYIREGRFPEAVAMMREVQPYRLRRPPHVQDADRNEARRALSELFLTLGRGEDAVRVTTKAMLAPDRRGHNSRDPAQDLALTALLDRAARRVRARERRADALGAPWLTALTARTEAAQLDLDAWSSGRQAARALSDEARLVGTFQIGRARSAVTPPWIVGDLVDVLGPGVVSAAVRRARREDPRPGAPAYYDAFEAEAALGAGDDERAIELADRALGGLPAAELLLRARTNSVIARAADSLGDSRRALTAYDQVLQMDPGLIVRLDATLPVRIASSGGGAPAAVADLLAWSPHLEIRESGLRVDVHGDPSRVTACLASSAGVQYECVETTRNTDEDLDSFASRAARTFLAQAFAPRVDLSQTDANGLDGSNVVSRQPLRTLLGIPSD